MIATSPVNHSPKNSAVLGHAVVIGGRKSNHFIFKSQPAQPVTCQTLTSASISVWPMARATEIRW